MKFITRNKTIQQQLSGARTQKKTQTKPQYTTKKQKWATSTRAGKETRLISRLLKCKHTNIV
jgi:hypothetical protein